jgi:7,8-dihydro-6-hydroxymethylpterin dimethyltransferase
MKIGGLMMKAHNGEDILGATESVCPVCLKRITAKLVAIQDKVYLDKTCLEHGDFRTIIWRGQPAYQSWGKPRISSRPAVWLTNVSQG